MTRVPEGRLKSFMDADVADINISLPVTPPSLPPRRPAAPPAPAAAEPAPAAAVTAPLVPLPSSPVSDTPTDPVPGAAAELKGPDDRVRPSNVHIPIVLLKPLEDLCATKKLSHGEAIIVAIEATYPRMKELINPGVTAGGSLFASRRSGRASRSSDGPLTPLNYRLREGDFRTLDHLVEEFGASSRGHLITAALTAYLLP